MTTHYEAAHKALCALGATRYANAVAIFWSGSVARGKGHAASDLDLIVVFEKMPTPYRETFYYQEWPIDACLHDRDTLTAVYETWDKPRAVPTQWEMIKEGVVLPEPNQYSEQLKSKAQQILAAGPPRLSPEQIDDYRFKITNLIEGIVHATCQMTVMALATQLFETLPTFYLRYHQQWVGKGKSILRYFEKFDPTLYQAFTKAFIMLYQQDNKKYLINFAIEMLAPVNGKLWSGYHAPLLRSLG